MKTKSTFLLIVFLSFCILAGAQSTPTEITAEYGPPAEANVWEHFTIPLTAETFNVDEITFDAVLAGVTSFWIRTEMHTGYDIGGIDDVFIGTTYWSYFEGSADGWSSGGDGTMEWMPTGGVDGGYLQISDWATGDWHWLIAPSTWAGDWTSLKGQNIQFWYKTDQPSYAAIVKITTGVIDRLVINTPVISTILPNDSVLIELEVLPAPTADITVSFSTSDPTCIKVPPSITVLAGYSTAYVYFVAVEGAAVGCESVIEATSPGYLTSRITMLVLDNYGIEESDLSKEISIFPNPCNGKFILSNTSGKRVHQVMMYDLSGNAILDLQEGDLSNTEIDVTNQPAGIYFLRIFVDGKVITSKIIIK
ncbi:MAG: T9SS type A sorting domain-containing protein [Bacteroidales bacterium]|nr:T9SS type A sorting domain-containing protein [Bacteroidales bacterium]